MSHSTSANHTVGTTYFGANSAYAGGSAQGGHAHANMIFTDPDPVNRQLRLIEADANTATLPQYACVLKHSSGGFTGTTRVTNTVDRIFQANTADSEDAGKVSMSITTSSEGAHNHGGHSGILPAGSAGGAYSSVGFSPGGHQHTFTAAITINLYRVALSAWYDAAAAWDGAPESGMIIMYENTTPPNGWSLCDGTNGTPDMRDYFVELVNDDLDAGNVSGDGNLSSVSVTNSLLSHTHTNYGQ